MERTRIVEGRNFLGYLLPNNVLSISIIAIFTALNFIVTYWIQIPIPATGGYINVGDITVMFTALLFGPIIGGITGGLGPMLADFFSGPYIIYAPATLIIKGIEGFVIGIISNPKGCKGRISLRDGLAVIIGGILIPLGYFIYEAFILRLGVFTALAEVPGNFFQFIVAAVFSILLIIASRKNIIEGLPQVFNKIFVSIESEE
ncbi:MAG: ECF transporter S component [Candidatus Lokiarchaeota archaeon]|nr:ECF transporter S component [Candidatus Lokiarchaeota archaeon]